MTSAAWRDFAHRPGGVLLTLLLVMLLVLAGHFCPMPAQAASLSAPAVGHDGCSDAPPSDSPTQSFQWFCDGGACLHSVGHHDAADRLAPSVSGWDEAPPLPAGAGLLPPDWVNGAHTLPASTVPATGPPPLQRSRVLRL